MSQQDNPTTELQPPSMPDFSASDDIASMKQELDDGIDEIKKAMPSDPVAKLAEVKEGSEEHMHQSELVDRVKAINSTGRVLRATKVIRAIGYVALLIGAVVKLTGITFDINYHLPFFTEMVGEWGLYTLGLFLAIVIISVSHIATDGFINDKWRVIPRGVLIWLLMFALTASIYFDYRAITNYTSIVMEKVKEKTLNSKNSTEHIATAHLNSANGNTERQIANAQGQLESIANRLAQIGKERENYNAIITAYASKKKHSRAEWLNQKTANKALETLDDEEDRLTIKQNTLTKRIEALEGKIASNTEKIKSEVGSLDAKLKEEQHNRIIFLFVLVLFIEVFSFGNFLADFLEDKNLKPKLKKELDSIDGVMNEGAVIKNHIRKHKLQTIQAIASDLEMGRNFIGAINTSGHMQLMGQVATVNNLTQNVSSLTKATNDMSKMAIAGIASSYKMGMANSLNKELMREMEKIKEMQSPQIEVPSYSDPQKPN